MKIPSQIRIGGHTISVEFQNGLLEYNQAFGVFDPTNLKILIDADIEDGLKVETFWHEVIEALNFFCEANMDHSKIQIFGVLLHQIAESIEEGSQNETGNKKKRG
tara:strand:+ start:976 stop:1290 length:315 start_codon:yes stop_codon:yes gene_type:complete